MSAAKSDAAAPADNNMYRVTAGGPFANAWKIAAAVGVLGLVGAFVGWSGDARRFAFSYLFAFFAFLTISLGAMFFVLVQYLTSAGWSVTVRRTAEFMMVAIPVFALLFVPVFMSRTELYPWFGLTEPASSQESGPERMRAHEGHDTPTEAAHEGAHDAASAEALYDLSPVGPAARSVPVEAEQRHILTLKAWWLTPGKFAFRAVFYFLLWAGLAYWFFKQSTDQDKTRDVRHTVAVQRFAPAATFLFGLSLTAAAFDWIMALNPMWYSTIFGVQIFAGAAVTIHALVGLITLMMKRRGLLGSAVNVEHFHDIGKLTFGFTVFWAYISFSQFFLTWYASIPEETVFFHHRWGNSAWVNVSLALILVHFVLPFAMLLSRNAKRQLGLLPLGLVIIPVMHFVEAYWLVLPNYGRNVFETARQSYLALHWLDAACFLGVGGVYFAVVFYLMTRYPLIPVGDPRLERSLRFENA